jgi:hypothetical protein
MVQRRIGGAVRPATIAMARPSMRRASATTSF